MKVSFKHLLPLLLLSPYICAYVPNPDGDEDYSIALAAGRGSYADIHRDCNGNILSVNHYPFTEVAGKFSGRYEELSYGVTAGWTEALQPLHTWDNTSESGPILYAAPEIGLELKPVGIQVGGFFSLNGKEISIDKSIGRTVYPTGGLRLGNARAFHFTASFLRNFPVVSGGGVYDAGFAFPTDSTGRSQLWLGIGFLPYDGPVFSLKGDIRIIDHLAITPALHGGSESQFGLALGMRYTF